MKVMRTMAWIGSDRVVSAGGVPQEYGLRRGRTVMEQCVYIE